MGSNSGSSAAERKHSKHSLSGWDHHVYAASAVMKRLFGFGKALVYSSPGRTTDDAATLASANGSLYMSRAKPDGGTEQTCM